MPKLPAFRLVGRIPAILAELRRRARLDHDARCLAGLALLLTAAACTRGAEVTPPPAQPRLPYYAFGPASVPVHYADEDPQ